MGSDLDKARSGSTKEKFRPFLSYEFHVEWRKESTSVSKAPQGLVRIEPSTASAESNLWRTDETREEDVLRPLNQQLRASCVPQRPYHNRAVSQSFFFEYDAKHDAFHCERRRRYTGST